MICPGDDTKLTTIHTHSLTTNELIMSKQVMINMLRQGNNGAEILSILDALTSDTVETSEMTSDVPSPTLEYIDF
jgi:hypothetical protein